MKVAMGSTSQTQDITASSEITQPNGTVSSGSNRALLVQPSNAGHRTREAFSVVPEAMLRVEYLFNDYVRIGLGYQFLYWYGVARPGNIDRAINIQALQPFDQVGPARPSPQFSTTGFWAQGLSASLMFSF